METKPNLYQRIAAVMQEVQYLQKDDNVSTGGASSYKAISEEKVTEAVRAALIKNGLVILPVAQHHTLTDFARTGKHGNQVVSLTTVDVQYKIVNIDNPAEYELLASSGTGVDSQDKGVGKAMTYAYKYLLLRTFAIPTGNDPDKIHNEVLEREQAEAAHNRLNAAIRELHAAEKVAPVWNKYPDLHRDQLFKAAAADRKAQLAKAA